VIGRPWTSCQSLKDTLDEVNRNELVEEVGTGTKEDPPVLSSVRRKGLELVPSKFDAEPR
jgi:hypothetical protein